MVDYQASLLLITERLLPRHSTLHPTMMVMNKSTSSAKKAFVRNQNPDQRTLITQIMSAPVEEGAVPRDDPVKDQVHEEPEAE